MEKLWSWNEVGWLFIHIEYYDVTKLKNSEQ